MIIMIMDLKKMSKRGKELRKCFVKSFPNLCRTDKAKRYEEFVIKGGGLSAKAKVVAGIPSVAVHYGRGCAYYPHCIRVNKDRLDKQNERI